MNFINGLINKKSSNKSPPMQQQQQQMPQQQSIYMENQQMETDSPFYSIPNQDSGARVARLWDKETSEEDKKKPLMAVIVTLNTGSSFDQLFENQKQEPPEGGRVSVWKVRLDEKNMNDLSKSLNNRQEIAEDFRELFGDLEQVEPGSAVFNFECCSGCSETGFGGKPMDKATINAIGRLLHHGYFVMCSDFSLKALLAAWNTEILGACPFKQVGGYSSSCELRFVPGVLKECASAQLVTVGQLCENGEAHVHAMGGTIAYAPVKGLNLEKEPYTLELLTVITKADGVKPTVSNADCKEATIKDYSGYAGHSILTYKTGGNLLLSSCHWMELSHLSTSEENVFKTYELNQGVEYAKAKRAEYDAMPMAQKSQQLQFYATEMVQKSAPCKYKK